MKKLFGPMISILVGALTFVFLSIPYYAVKATGLVGGAENYNAWQILKEFNKDADGVLMFKVITIIAIVLASLLIIYGIVYLLGNFKFIKTKLNLKVFADILLVLNLVIVVLQLIALFIVCQGGSGALTIFVTIEKVDASPAVGMWLNLAIAIVGCLTSLFLLHT